MAIYRMTVKTSFPGGSTQGTNTWHFRSTSVPVPPTPTPTAMVKNFYDALKAQFGLTYKWTWDGTIQEVGNATPALLPVMTPWTVQGSSGGNSDSGPAGVGLCVTWRSTVANRSGRGRTFIAPLPAAWYQTDGTLLDANLTIVRTAAAALVSASLSDGNGAIAVYSPKDNLSRDVAGATITDAPAFLSSRRR